MALNRQKLANNLKAGSSFMNITSKYRSLSIQARAAAVANVVLNFIFIRIFGYVAAGYTTLACYILYSVGHYVVSKRILVAEGRNWCQRQHR